jgi:hypothetical protein
MPSLIIDVLHAIENEDRSRELLAFLAGYDPDAFEAALNYSGTTYTSCLLWADYRQAKDYES